LAGAALPSTLVSISFSEHSGYDKIIYGSMNISPVPTMEAFAEEYKVHTFDYELMDMGRDTLGVSFLASTLFSSAHHPVPLVLSIMGSQRTNSKMPKKFTRNMAALLAFARTLLKIQIWSLSFVRAVKSQLPFFPLTNCSKLLRTPVVSVCPTRGYQ
jgi:hypothetical protein